MTKIPTFIISLPASEDAYHAVVNQLDTSIFEPRAPMGVSGRSLPDSICIALTRDPESINNKGALGCTLAHVRVWEIVARLDVPHVLILEDDVTGTNLERARSLSLPAGFDIVFCNDRTATVSARSGADEPVRCIDIAYTLLEIEARGLSVGTDAYFVSPRGAKALVERYSRDGYFGHVDRRMLAYSIETPILERYKDIGPMTAELLQFHQIVSKRPALSTYSCFNPLFTHTGVASRRTQEDIWGRSGPGLLLQVTE